MSSSFRGKSALPGSSRGLFPNQTQPDSYLIAHIDGGARGNPGPAGYGVVITDQAGHKVMGRNRSETSNVTTGEQARRSMEASAHSSVPTSAPPSRLRGQEFSGVVRDGVIVVQGAKLPEGTRVQIRVLE